ncbi:MAG: RNA 3'-phosphate cyclase, partial [Nitrospinae bacterium]|nr:RNA 3'-phosphate cyclase [Nitrospinota bacterium]
VEAWLPCLQRMGFHMELTLQRAGFYPQGGGELGTRIHPIPAIQPVRLETRGALQAVRVFSAHTNLKDEVADRQARAAQRALREAGLHPIIECTHLPSLSHNTVCAVTGIFEATRVCYTALGERGKRAEQVAEEACTAFLAFLQTAATVDEYLADQLLLPLALATGPSVFWTPRVTQHLLTNLATIQTFLPVTIGLTGTLGHPGRVEVIPAAA